MKTFKKYTLRELEKLTNSKLDGDPNHEIFHINTLKDASTSEASFLANPKYFEEYKRTSAGVICIDSKTPRIEGKNHLISEDPSKVFQMIAKFFCQSESLTGFEGIHPTAIIHPTAKIGQNVQIGPFVVIDQNVEIGDYTVILTHCYVGSRTKIGSNCRIYSSVIIREDCLIGNRVILQPGCVIGSCGFGYLTDKNRAFQKLEQLGIVVIEDDVEIGANTTIDRARFKETKISNGSKIDNLVQIAHNVEIGPHNAIAAQAGFAGSSSTKEHVLIGGQVGISGHVSIEKNTMIAAQSGVSKTHKPNSVLRGTPAVEIEEFNNQMIALRRLSRDLQKKKVFLKSSTPSEKNS